MAQVAFEDNGEQFDETETFSTGSPGDIVEFNASAEPQIYFEEEVKVWNTTPNGDRMYEGTDYIWYEDNGTLEVLSQDLANQTDAEINYSYHLPSQTQRNFQTRIGTLFGIGQWVPLIFAVILILIAAGALGGLT